MRRFFGMMPSSEIEIEKHYKDENGYKITIQAGVNGWTIIYADSSSDFKDVTISTDENFKENYKYNEKTTLIRKENICKQSNQKGNNL